MPFYPSDPGVSATALALRLLKHSVRDRKMRAFGLTALLIAGSILSSCNRGTHRDEPASREVGRDAYRASQEIKRGAKEGGQELKNAGKELREGWNEAKREDTGRKK